MMLRTVLTLSLVLVSIGVQAISSDAYIDQIKSMDPGYGVSVPGAFFKDEGLGCCWIEVNGIKKLYANDNYTCLNLQELLQGRHSVQIFGENPYKYFNISAQDVPKMKFHVIQGIYENGAYQGCWSSNRQPLSVPFDVGLKYPVYTHIYSSEKLHFIANMQSCPSSFHSASCKPLLLTRSNPVGCCQYAFDSDGSLGGVGSAIGCFTSMQEGLYNNYYCNSTDIYETPCTESGGKYIPNGRSDSKNQQCVCDTISSHPLECGATVVETKTDQVDDGGGSIEFIPQVSIPFTNITAGEGFEINGLSIGKYVNDLYVFAVSIGGFIAVITIIFGGAQWLISRGNANEVAQAKGFVQRGVIGFIFLLGMHAFLSLISKNLTSFRTLEIDRIDPEFLNEIIADNSLQVYMSSLPRYVKTEDHGYCKGVDPVSVTNNTTPDMIVSGGEKLINENIFSIADIKKYAQSVRSETGFRMMLTSGLRSPKKQDQLWAGYQCAAKGLSVGGVIRACDTDNRTITDIRCAAGTNMSTFYEIIRDYGKNSDVFHYCTSAQRQNNVAAKANCATAPHLKGNAIDVKVDTDEMGTINVDNMGSIHNSNKDRERLKLVYKLQKSLTKHGLNYLCFEWWHFEKESAGTQGRCTGGEYTVEVRDNGDIYLTSRGKKCSLTVDGLWDCPGIIDYR